jgi:hypothetical membrane protein
VTTSPYSLPGKAKDVRLAGLLFVATGIEMLLLIPVFEALYPGFRFTEALSDLDAIGSPVAIPATLAPAIQGILLFVGAYFLFRKTGKHAFFFFVISFLAGLLPTFSPENYNVAIHSIGSIISFIMIIVIEVWSYTEMRSPFRYFALFFGALTTVAIIVLFTGYYTLVPATIGVAGWETMIVYPNYIWSIGFGSYLLTVEGSEGLK